jgi:two-component system, cell cycle sensor histidine kinase and response regulator CckA
MNAIAPAGVRQPGPLAVWHHLKLTGARSADRHAASLQLGCLALSVALGLLLIHAAGWERSDMVWPLASAELAALGAFTLSYRGERVWAARLAAYGVLLSSVLMVTQAHDGFRSIVMLAFPGVLLIAVMLLDGVDYSVLAAATLLAVTGLGVAEMHGLSPVVPITRTTTDLSTIAIVDLILLVLAFFGQLLTRDARRNLAEIRAAADQLAAANRELTRSAARYQSFIELAVDAIFVVDRRGHVLEVNRQASTLTGIEASQLTGASMTDLLSPAEPASNPFPLEVLARGVPIMRPCRIRRPGGAVVEAETHSAMLPDGLILCFCRDIGERKRAEEERKRLQEQLVQAQKMESIGRLAGGVAHDFNNLLTVINGYSQMLLGTLDAEHPGREGLEEIRRAGDRAAALTRQLLAFSRKQILQPCLVDCNRVVREIEPMLARLLGNEMKLLVNLCAGAATVFADPHQLEQVLMNLAVNARDAMPGGGAIRIETATAGSFVMLLVEDTGIGMDEETRRHIFEPFFTTKGAGKGTGLGLSMTQGIVEQSGGHIEVDSEPGRGTAFRVFLPVAPRMGNSVAATSTALTSGPSAGPVRILVADDEAGVRGFLRTALEQEGYRVTEAGEGKQALQWVRGGEIDLVITDLVMPEQEGIDIIRTLHRDAPGVAVIAISGAFGGQFLRTARLLGASAVLSKPVPADVLRATVADVLRRKES